MRNTKWVYGKLTNLTRLPNSYYGNPRYSCVIGNVECRTGIDASLGYGITNHEDKLVRAMVGDHYNHKQVQHIENV